MEERDLERWAQFQFVLTSYTVFLTVTCRDDILFICGLCNNSTSDTEAAVKHLVNHSIWKRDNVKGHCDICTFYYLSGIESIKQLRDFSGALNGCTHNIAACLLSNLKISLHPFTGRIGLKSQTVNWSGLFSKQKPSLSGSSVPDAQQFIDLTGNKFTSFVQPNNVSPMIPPPMLTSLFSPGDTFTSNPLFPSPTMLHNQGQPFIRPPRPEFLQPPTNALGQSRLTFEQHMARERMLWILDERHKRQMAAQGMRARMKRRSAVQISPTNTTNKETVALRDKENRTSGRKRSRPNNSQPITVIDLTDAEEENDVVATGVDNVSSTTSNGDAENAPKKSPDKGENKNENTKSKDDSEAKDKPGKDDKTDNENELHSTVSSDQTETHIYYDEIFLEDDNGFLGDVAEGEDEATNQQILDLSLKKDEATSIGTDIIPLDLTNELEEG